jgi:thiamine-phosphate pyrophosphorylase
VAARAGWTVPALADAFLTGGARFVQLRAKSTPGGALLKMCVDVVAQAHTARAVVVVNDRADLARASGADGVHLGQDDLPPGMARQMLPGDAIVGISTHSIEQVDAASRLPVDYIAVGPIFGTTSKDTGYRAVGITLVREARLLLSKAGLAIPIVAIGGITLSRAASVFEAGASSVAVISDLLSTGNPALRVREYLTLGGAYGGTNH